MRDIKFRGFNLITEQWYYGDLIHYKLIKTTYFIRYQLGVAERICEIQVEPESVGQFTGYKSFHGDDIYEGDITTHGTVIFDNGMFYLKEGNTFEVLGYAIGSRRLLDIIGNVQEGLFE